MSLSPNTIKCYSQLIHINNCTTVLTGGENKTSGPNDIVLEVIYYDFSKTHADFQDIEYLTISQPAYVASPYGAWLSVSSTPNTDTFSEWYRSVPGTNEEIVDTLILEAQTGTLKRYFHT